MSGIIYYYWKSSWKTFLPAFCLATAYPLGVVLMLTFTEVFFENGTLPTASVLSLFAIVPAIAYILFCVNAVTGSLEIKEKKKLKILLSAPVAQEKALLGKYIFVGVATAIFTVIALIFCVVMNIVIDIDMASTVKMTFTILGIRLILSAFEVPLYHIFNKQTTSNIMMGTFLILIIGFFIASMFVNMDTQFEIGKKLLDLAKNKYMPIGLNLAGIALTVVSYFGFSKVRQEIE